MCVSFTGQKNKHTIVRLVFKALIRLFALNRCILWAQSEIKLELLCPYQRIPQTCATPQTWLLQKSLRHWRCHTPI